MLGTLDFTGSGHRDPIKFCQSTALRKLETSVSELSIRSLRSNDGDGNENGKKPGLDWQNNNFARASRFFAHFFAVVARLQPENV